jgi:3-dehydroquinate dehydratase-1
MNSIDLISLDFHAINVVAVVESLKGFALADAFAPGAVDALELRLDLLETMPQAGVAARLRLPWIATARDPSEGGNPSMPEQRRIELLEAAIGQASGIDVELRNVGTFARIVRDIVASPTILVVSCHDFQAAPSLPEAQELLRRAVVAGADVFKLAMTPHRASEVGALMGLFDSPEIPVSLMAMGRWGLPARLMYAAAGSVLNYGWVEKPVVSGQWQAVELKRQIALVTGGEGACGR